MASSKENSLDSHSKDKHTLPNAEEHNQSGGLVSTVIPQQQKFYEDAEMSGENHNKGGSSAPLESKNIS